MGYLDVTRQAAAAYFSDPPEGPVVMLNLLRFREVADYSASPELAPDQPISGEDAYRRYGQHAMPFLDAVGSEVIFSGTGGDYLIGPEDGHWDRVLLVRHASARAFLDFAGDAGYQSGVGHRTAALADSRLLPMSAD